ncbi:hypothetical protein GA0116948_104151 [Chitinophaga costaii]|uniref:Uncharacterized protein n=1 Tax=Chitinophaga costaii TaxID=1335309 RepID=A0A1C4CJ39_9BACT|nr:hypothetical protein [Chitinophaga costaii]PUZ27069.1 hypothetical protein DCM91_07530 [Chitinophaga costaii]SCC19121.1 hypothetical protein GA0116948_104151 [Chitinophaga costaii]
MLKQITLSLCLLLLSFQTPDIITAIQHKCQEIDAAKPSFAHLKKNEDGISAEGAAIDGYYDISGFRIITESVYAVNSQNKTTLYFDPKNQLILVDDRLITYAVPMYDTTFNLKDSRTVASRYYFNQRKMVKWLGPRAKDSTHKKYADQQAAWLDYADNMVKQMTKYYIKNSPPNQRYLPLTGN